MGAVCDTALELGAPNYGVMPEFMRGLEYQGLTELRWAPTMSIRKELMRDGVCLAVTLPGGIGTMDEMFETMVLAKLGRFHGRLVALNLDGFYEPLKALLKHFVDEGMLEPEDAALLEFVDTPEEFAKKL